ncbi:MAG: hypothetical protein ACTSYM_11470 [Candidatus Baldrarchaeia archaeon]
MNHNKRKPLYLSHVCFTLIPLLIVMLMLELVYALPVGSGVQFHTGSGYFTFTKLLTINSSIAVNGGWNLTDVYLTGDDQTLGYVWLYTSAGHLSISHLIYNGKFTASVTVPSRTPVTIKVKISKWKTATPRSIKIGNQYYPIMARSMREFNKADYPTWYWSKGILYLKVMPQSTVSIEVNWLQSPPTEEPTPAPPSEEEEEVPTPPPPSPLSPKGLIETIISYLNYAVILLRAIPLNLWLLIIVIIIILIILKS